MAAGTAGTSAGAACARPNDADGGPAGGPKHGGGAGGTGLREPAATGTTGADAGPQASVPVTPAASLPQGQRVAAVLARWALTPAPQTSTHAILAVILPQGRHALVMLVVPCWAAASSRSPVGGIAIRARGGPAARPACSSGAGGAALGGSVAAAR